MDDMNMNQNLPEVSEEAVVETKSVEDTKPAEEVKPAKKPLNIKTLIGGLALVILVILAAINSGQAQVNLIFTSISAPLIVIIFIAGMLGFLTGYLLHYFKQ